MGPETKKGERVEETEEEALQRDPSPDDLDLDEGHDDKLSEGEPGEDKGFDR